MYKTVVLFLLAAAAWGVNANLPDFDFSEGLALNISGNYRWEWTVGTTEPCSDVVTGGVGVGTSHLTVGRVHHFGNLLPCLVQVSTTEPAIYTFGGDIFTTNTYEVLCGYGVAWIPANRTAISNPSVTSLAVPSGYTEGGSSLYTCRAISDKRNQAPDASFVPGLVDPETGLCNITYSTSSSTYNVIYTASTFELLIDFNP